ncbi:pentapeptide repeat-containing protein [Nostoc sp. UIC 10630]|uniref:pentapeptide repeat-containing protein n=1 Tax=Nostoc sp. UIC 10630 TaxID=2100146 RepID=UPI0013D37BD3|nr:pentapeptide repeat-containing protein [Nostoc sp. UIC 10630]NEU84257.1 pentapeptide repeat-containing protein [Nostoc sp. UIC 10630]
MANEEHLAILTKGVEVWNEWRKDNPNLMPKLQGINLSVRNLSKANFTGANLNRVTFTGAILFEVNLTGAYLNEAILSGTDLRKGRLNGAKLTGADLTKADLCEADLSEALLNGAYLQESILKKANLNKTNFNEAYLNGCDCTDATFIEADLNSSDLSMANLSGANFSRAKLFRTNLSTANLTKAILKEAQLIASQVLTTNFTSANLTGACIEDWNINSNTNLTNVICDYIYLRERHQERRPSSGNFAYGEFTQLFQKSLETVDLIFRNAINWDAFAYSFRKLEVENQGAQLDVQSIEKKGDGILVVRVAVSPDANKAGIHSDFMQGYEFAAKALEVQYQERLEDKEKVINQLFSTINQQNQLLAQTGDKVSIYYQPNSQFAGGIVDATNVDAQQIGGNIQNNDT